MTRKFVTSGISAYSGNFGKQEAKHLLNRALFGGKQSEIDFFATKTLNEAVTALLDENEPSCVPPVTNSDFDNVEETAAYGTTWVNEGNTGDGAGRVDSLTAWWAGEMIEQNATLKEKMGLFFFNHIPVNRDTYHRIAYYEYVEYFKENYMGNLKDILKHICIDWAMLKFLNGNENNADAPNENFGRELLELFTIGKGPQIGDGDYTHYNEDDVKAAAKVMTGWKIDWNTGTSHFISNKHDKTQKKFSAALSGATIDNNEELEFTDLIDMLFLQKECARFFCRKLYRFFVHYHIDDTIEANIIEPLATILHDGGYELKPVYETLFQSEHFFDINIQGGLIKNPLELHVGSIRKMQMVIPTKAEVDKRYLLLKREVYWVSTGMGLELGNPPSVAGWAPYYSAPSFHRLWINSVTYPTRQWSALAQVYGYSKTVENVTYSYGLNIEHMKSVIQDITSTESIVRGLTELLLPTTVPNDAIGPLMVAYDEYRNWATDKTIDDHITALIQKILIMPEYQLS